MYLLVCSVIARSFFFYILCILVISELLSSMYIYVFLAVSLSLSLLFFLSIYLFVEVLSLKYIIESANGCKEEIKLFLFNIF